MSNSQDWPRGKVGYVALIGRPNVGKSTLLNTVLDYQLAAVSEKPQTTRKRWLGILCDDKSQILFLDTPGIHTPKHALGEAMEDGVRRALEDADVVVCLVDPTRSQGEEDERAAATVAGTAKPVILALNKTDIAREDQIRAARQFYEERVRPAVVVRISALNAASAAPLLDAVKDRLPTGPFLFPGDTITDAFEREIAAEMIRQAALDNLRQEIPHAIAVTIEEWQEDVEPRRVKAVIHVEREQQKHIVIGKGGSMIKKLTQSAEAAMARAIGPVRLTLWVKVSRDWRRKRSMVDDLSQGSGPRGRA